MRGYALTQLDRHEEAIRDFDEAMRFDANAKLFLLRGLSYEKLGRLERASCRTERGRQVETRGRVFKVPGATSKKAGPVAKSR